MKVLHILPPGGTTWGRGIPAVLRTLAEAPELAWVEFRFTPLDQLATTLLSWHPDLYIWHPAFSWRLLAQFLKLRGLKGISYEHHYCAGFENYRVPSRWRFRAMLRLAYGQMVKVVAVSQGQAAWLKQAHLVQRKCLEVIPFTPPLEPFYALPLERDSAHPLRLGAFGRFVEQKGFETLIDAVKLLQAGSFHLSIGGDGDLDDALRNRSADHPSISFLGPILDVPAFLSHCDVIVIPSRWEPWGAVCLEVRAAGLPVIVSDVDGLSEQVQDCGYLVPPDDPQALAAAIAGMITASPSERTRMAVKARESCMGSWSAFVDSWNQLLRSLQ